jgi:prepilin-type N-terminal cleavage/methylation domain-containing protein
MRHFGKNGFTLVELLVVTSMIAVLSVATIVLLNPIELLRQSRDNTRISNMSTLMVVLGAYRAELCPNDIGSPSTTYVSIPDTDPACGNLGLPTLTGGLSYHCAASDAFRQPNSSGWIPVDFTQISSGAPLSNLPIDPVNESSSGFYYTFHPSIDGMNWELTSVMESEKFASRMTSDGGASDFVYEVGPDLGLAPYTVINRCNPNATSTPPGGDEGGGGGGVGVTTTITQTDDTNSNAGFNLSGVSHSQTQITGTGSAASVILAESSSRPAAPSCSGTDHSGAAWTVTDNDAYDLNAAAGTIEIAGEHCNVGAFSIPAGRTVYIKRYATGQYGQLKVSAASIDVSGNLYGDARGYPGGDTIGASGTNTGSYGGVGGPGGIGGGGNPGGTSVGSTRGTADGTDIDMGGGAGAGGAGNGGAGYGQATLGAAGSPGGGSAYLYASGNVSISGIVSMNGGTGGIGGNGDAGDCSTPPGEGAGGGAGGSGGGVLVNGSAVTINGTLMANAGAGGDGGWGGDQYEYEGCGLGVPGDSGGYGGGGRLKVFGSSLDTTGSTLSVTGDSVGTTFTSAGSSYYSDGTYTSGPIDTGAATVAWRTISWTHSGGQTIGIKARSANVSDMTGATAWNSCTAIVSGGTLASGGCVTTGHRYVQYQATFMTADNAITPSLDDVIIIYTQ